MTRVVSTLAKPSRTFGWALCALVSLAAGRSAADPIVKFQPAKKGQLLVVEVTGLSKAEMDRLRQSPNGELAALLAVRVDGAKSAMLGTYRVEKDRLRYESRFPGSPGVTYRAEFDPSQAPIHGNARLVAASATVPKPSGAATTELAKVYPTRDRLPENQLKFYLHFSAPMSRGDSYSHIRLLDDKGKEINTPFLELGEELWDADTKRFTLLLHPGRVKRGLQLREDLGPVLEEGKSYLLVIDAKWPDAEGNPLKVEFRKSFSVGKPDNTQPDPKTWTLEPPTASKSEPLTVGFPKPLDHALLQRVVRVQDARGEIVAGTVKITNEETRWQFTPNKPWQSGNYRLVVEVILEDLAGNSIARPFEVDIVQPLPQPDRGKTVSREFEVK